jgi:hypothetical protein
MLRNLILVSLVIAAFFIVNSAFRRRLIWSIQVTLGFYGVMTVIRIVVVGIFKIFQPGEDDSGLFMAIAAIGLVSAAVWVLFRYWTERQLRKRAVAGPQGRGRRGRR